MPAEFTTGLPDYQSRPIEGILSARGIATLTWHVYLLRCADDTLYTGVTTDLARRLRQHNGELAGGPKYTRTRRPVQLAWCLAVASRSEALREEVKIKRLPRSEKFRLTRH